MYGLRDKVVTVRVDSELLEKFKQAVQEKEGWRYKKTNTSDLMEKALKDYTSSSNSSNWKIRVALPAKRFAGVRDA